MLHPETKYLNPQTYQNVYAKQILRAKKGPLLAEGPGQPVVKHIKSPSLAKPQLHLGQIDSYELIRKPRSVSPSKYDAQHIMLLNSQVRRSEPSANHVKLPSIKKASISSRNSPTRVHNEIILAGLTSRKALVAEDIRKFEEKYQCYFREGYSNTIIDNCLDLLNKEDDPVVLENIFPGKYTEYIMNASRPYPGIVKSINKNSYQLLKNSISQGLKESLLPPIRVFPQSTKSAKQYGEYGGNTPSERQESLFNIPGNEDAALSGFGMIRPGHNLPRVNIETFKKTLAISSGKSMLIQLGARNKTIPLDFGFCEVIFEDGKGNSGFISKYFICKIYRKMKIVELITLQLLDYLFKKHALERLRIDLIKSNDSIHKEMKRVGFKLQKVDKVDTKYKTYLLKRDDFDSLMTSIIQEEQLSLGRK